MKARWKFKVVLTATSVLCALFLLRSGSSEQKALEETRRALRQQGFKNIHILQNGWTEWSKAGYPTNTGAQP